MEEEYKMHLTDILSYHVLPNQTVMAADLMAGPLSMGNGGDAFISLDPAMINDATIITPDLKAENGVVHVIDKVLIPPPTPAPPAPVPMPAWPGLTEITHEVGAVLGLQPL